MTTITTIEEVQDTIEETLEEKYNPLVNAIRTINGKKQIVEIHWNELTEDEKRAAYCAQSGIYE